MPEYSDVYVLSDKRDSSSINQFLEHFLPDCEESADEYEVPQYSKTPKLVFNTADKLIEYCAKNTDLEYSIYWRASVNSKPEHAMAFYLSDGNVIYGLSTDAANQAYALSLLEDIPKL